MKTCWKGALAALAFAGAAAAATAPVHAQSFGLTFGPRGGIGFSFNSGGYCDDIGCPGDFWDMPVYYGPVFWEGQWYDGPLYYRDGYGRRQFWIHGDWRFDEWRGPHPGWWREGRYGPPLGADYYRQHGFHGPWDHGGPHDNGFGPRGGVAPRDDHGGYPPHFDNGFNRGGDPRALDQRGPQGNPGHNRGPQPQAARPQPAPQQGPQAHGHGAPPPAPGGQHHDHDHDH
jgi:hypothetical protein